MNNKMITLALLAAAFAWAPGASAAMLNWNYAASQIAPAGTQLSMSELAAVVNEQGPNAPYHVDFGVTSSGVGADAMKVLQTNNPAAPYIGMYHHLNAAAGRFETFLAQSNDLKTWTTMSMIHTAASMPDAVILPDNSVLYAEERNPTGNRPVIAVNYYATLAGFLSNPSAPTRTITLPKTASASADGTPQFGRITYNGSITNSKIEITHHYFYLSTRDQQAIGTLTNFNRWSSSADTWTNATMAGLGYRHLGDREHLKVATTTYELLEGNLDEPSRTNGWANWRLFLINKTSNQVQQLAPAIPGGAYSVGNPSATFLTLPDGRPALVLSYFLFSEGASATPAGPHLYIYPL